MKLDDDHDFGKTPTGSKTHIVSFATDPPSMLILGSDDYDVGVDFRAACGTVSEFDDADEPDDRSGYCYACVRTAIARGYAIEPDPFDPSEVKPAARNPADHEYDD